VGVNRHHAALIMEFVTQHFSLDGAAMIFIRL
jgi:hypothetical protein